MLKSYQAGIAGLRWLVSERSDAEPVLQYGLRPLHGGAPDWFDVSTEVATPPAPALPPVARLPLTEEGMHALILSIPHNGRASDDIGYVTDIARAIEKAHLIGIEASTGEQS